MENLHSLIRSAREQHALSQEALAAMLGVPQSLISLWEGGYRNPTLLHMMKLAMVFDDDDALLDTILARIKAEHDQMLLQMTGMSEDKIVRLRQRIIATIARNIHSVDASTPLRDGQDAEPTA